ACRRKECSGAPTSYSLARQQFRGQKSRLVGVADLPSASVPYTLILILQHKSLFRKLPFAQDRSN
ncbi:hypothetical protein BHE74_00002244, partial [Ensete ventricosum]